MSYKKEGAGARKGRSEEQKELLPRGERGNESLRDSKSATFLGYVYFFFLPT